MMSWPPLAHGKSRLLVVTYHRVLPEPDPILPDEPDVTLFRVQMEFLAGNLKVLPLPEAVERLYAGSLPPLAAAVTFDDGYRNNHACALPVLRELGLPATFFVATGHIGGGRMFNDSVIETLRRCPEGRLDLRRFDLGHFDLDGIAARRAAIGFLIPRIKYRPAGERESLVQGLAEAAGVELPRDLMMDWDQVRDLHRHGMDIGGHTVTHPILARLDDGAALREIRLSREMIEAETGEAPRSFAYPNGQPGEDFLPRDAAFVREAGFDFALTTTHGCATPADDRYGLPRISLWSRTPARLALNILRAHGAGSGARAR